MGGVIDLTRVQHVKIPVSDLAHSLAWYRDLLDLELTHEFTEQGVVRGVSLLHRRGGFSIALRDRAAIPGQPDLRGFDPFALGVGGRDALDALVTRCRQLGVAHQGVEERVDGAVLDVADPDGTVVRFYHLTAELDRFTGLAFGADGSVEVYEQPRLERR